MTLVVTHTNGFLGCFTKEPDGTMRQRALIDTGAEPPTPESLATMGEALAEQWRWNGHAVTVPAKPKALPTAAKPKPKRAYRIHPTDPRPAERPPLILAYLTEHPYSTLTEILNGLGMDGDAKGRVGRWHHTVNAMREAGQITRRYRGTSTQVYEWRVA